MKTIICPSGKIRYKNYEEAENALSQIQLHPKGTRRFRFERALYPCPFCGGVHLTKKINRGRPPKQLLKTDKKIPKLK